MSSLDDGVMSKPKGVTQSTRDSTQARKGKNMDFYSAIAKGENNNGQTTHAPGQVVCGGEVCYEQTDYPRNFQGGDRWSKPKR